MIKNYGKSSCRMLRRKKVIHTHTKKLIRYVTYHILHFVFSHLPLFIQSGRWVKGKFSVGVRGQKVRKKFNGKDREMSL